MKVYPVDVIVFQSFSHYYFNTVMTLDLPDVATSRPQTLI